MIFCDIIVHVFYKTDGNILIKHFMFLFALMYTYQQPLTKQYQTYNTVLVAALIKTFSVIINTYVYIKWISKFAIQFNFKV